METDYEKAAAEQERTEFKRLQEERHRFMRECPAGWFLDVAHLRIMLGQSPASTRPWLAWLYVALHGAAACGVAAADLTGGSDALAATVKRFRAGDIFWDPPAEQLAGIPAEIRARVIGQR